MSKTIRLMFVVMMSLFVVSMFSVKAKTKDLVVPIEEASIRTATLEVKQGLRFYAKLDESVRNNEHGFYLIFGETTVEILEAAILGAVDGEIFVNGKIVFKVPVSGVNEDNEYSVVLTGIPEKGYVDELSAIPYVVKDDDEKLPEALVKRSVLEVAISASNSGDPSDGITSILNYAQANTKMVSLTANKLMVSAFDSSALGNYKVYNIGDKVVLPIALEKDGYEFLYYENDEQMYAAGDLVTVGEVDVDYNLVYLLLTYSILYNDSWQDEFEFIDNFYFDFYNWLLTRDGKDGVVIAGNEIEMTVDGLTATVASVEELKGVIPETFAKTFGMLIYQPFVRADNDPVIPETDENYFLNCDNFRKKYEQLDDYFLNAILISFPLYDKGYNPDSEGSVEIFLAFQEWQQGNENAEFAEVPKEYKESGGPATYTIESNTVNLTEDLMVKVGYTFAGWYDAKTGGNQVISINQGSLGDKSLYARWTVKEYTITFYTTGGNEIAPITADYNSLLSVQTAPTKTGYTFTSWNKEMPERMPANNLEFVALWQINQYTISFNTMGGSAVASITQDYASVVVVPANPEKEYYDFVGWDEAVPLTMPAEDVELTAIWQAIKYFYFGEFPSTVVDDEDLILVLGTLTTPNSKGYYECGGKEYAKLTATPFAYAAQRFHNGTSIKNGKVYYFEVEPIKWRVLANDDGTLTLLTDLVIDFSVFYHDAYTNRTIDGETIYPNNYKHSDIRYWLNNNFYNSAFNAEEKDYILITTVDNSAATTCDPDNPYVCETTFDKVYLLSYKDVTTDVYGLNNNNERITTATDYGRARGANCYYTYCYWPQRSPAMYSGWSAWVNENGAPVTVQVNWSDARPTIRIKIT